LTVDAFASKSNSLLPRFFARYAEPDAEVEDAFTVPDWARSLCPSCDHCHRETLFAFTPASLLNAFVAKARTDGARAIVVTPLSVAASYWNKLLRASVVQNDAGYLRIRRQQTPTDSDVAGEPAVFAVDFAPYASRSPTTAYPPGCGMEARFRGRSLLGSPSDQAERARIRAEILSVGLSLRQGHLPPVLLRSNHEEGTRTLHTLYLYGIARNAYIRRTALGSILTVNGWLFSRPGSSRAPPTLNRPACSRHGRTAV
jgi:hypothetical protein